MKNNRLTHHRHFPLLHGGGWTGSRVPGRNGQGSHCHRLLVVQQILVLTVVVLLCPGRTLWGGWHTCCVLLRCPGTDPCSKKGCVKSGEAGLASASWTRCPRGQAWDQSRWSREKGNTRGTALVTQLISVTAATVKGF